ncbi:MAG: hypothetical protein AAF525_13100 [Pseudomonadota bacterium]
MNSEFVQYTTVVIELIGLSLIAIELYWPRSVVHIDGALSSVPESSDDRRTMPFVIGLIVAWVLISVFVTLVHPEMSIVVHLLLMAGTVLGLTIYWLIQRLISLGIFLGRGSAIGGVGLLLALTGVALEMAQL